MAQDPKNQKDAQGRPTGEVRRVTGPQKTPERERSTGSVSGARSIAERERLSTSFGDDPRERVTGPQRPPERERVTGKLNLSPSAAPKKTTGTIPIVAMPPAGAATTAPKQLTQHQKSMLSSAFQDQERMRQLRSVVGNTDERRRDDDDDDEPTHLGRHFDGQTPAPELTGRDLFKAVQAPVQSREGRRSKKVLEQVLNQFAVGNNPRYAPDAPGKPRAHIFVWDVSRAMNCEVPHFIGAKELTVGQTVDWLRHEGPGRGWVRASGDDALSGANEGVLVIAVPKEVRLKQLAIVLPVSPDPDGRPRLAAAAAMIGGNLSVYEALGVYAAEYFAHP